MSDHVRGWTARVGLRQPAWQCTECWYRDQPCDHAELGRMQAHRTRCRVGCPCTFTADCPHCVGGRHQCRAFDEVEVAPGVTVAAERKIREDIDKAMATVGEMPAF